VEKYITGKQTYAQLSLKYACSIKSIQRRIDTVKITKAITFPFVVNFLMNTTYFGMKFGVMVFKDALSGQFLLNQYVKQETNNLYLQGVEEITRKVITILP